MKLNSYPKIWNLGHAALGDLLKDRVVIQEKIDGSQFSFGQIGGELHLRSKGAVIYVETADKLFQPAVQTAVSLYERGLLTEGFQYRGEAVCKPKHNTICYERAPKNGFILFDVDRGLEDRLLPATVAEIANELGLEVVPTYFHGYLQSLKQLQSYLERDSILGGPIEGMVIKSYTKWGRDGKQLMAKLVREEFKERNKKEFRSSNPTVTDIIESLIHDFRSERRWEKATQRLRDDGQLECSPRDIGKLMKWIPEDIKSECEEEIKDALFKWAWPKIRRSVVHGVPEWYKDQLALRQFSEAGTPHMSQE